MNRLTVAAVVEFISKLLRDEWIYWSRFTSIHIIYIGNPKYKKILKKSTILWGLCVSWLSYIWIDCIQSIVFKCILSTTFQHCFVSSHLLCVGDTAHWLWCHRLIDDLHFFFSQCRNKSCRRRVLWLAWPLGLHCRPMWFSRKRMTVISFNAIISGTICLPPSSYRDRPTSDAMLELLFFLPPLTYHLH